MDFPQKIGGNNLVFAKVILLNAKKKFRFSKLAVAKFSFYFDLCFVNNIS